VRILVKIRACVEGIEDIPPRWLVLHTCYIACCKNRKRQSWKFQQPKSTEMILLRFAVSVKNRKYYFYRRFGEVFNEIVWKCEINQPMRLRFMITHCNGSSGYLITDEPMLRWYEVNLRGQNWAEKAIIEPCWPWLMSYSSKLISRRYPDNLIAAWRGLYSWLDHEQKTVRMR